MQLLPRGDRGAAPQAVALPKPLGILAVSSRRPRRLREISPTSLRRPVSPIYRVDWPNPCTSTAPDVETPKVRIGGAPWQGGAFQWVQVPPGDSLPPEAIGAVMEVTKWLKPSISGSRIGDRASVQAATRVNAEQASKRTMCRPTRTWNRGRLTRLGDTSEDDAQPLHRGSGGSMHTRKAHATREAPMRDQR